MSNTHERTCLVVHKCNIDILCISIGGAIGIFLNQRRGPRRMPENHYTLSRSYN